MTDNEPTPSAELDEDWVPSASAARPDFWGTPQLQTIKQAADAKMVPHMTMLVLTLTALTAEIDYRVRIDSRGDGNPHEYGNLNIFTAAIGQSGNGKSEAVKAARYLVGRREALNINPTSGEGILSMFKDYVEVQALKMDPATGKVKPEREKRYVWVSRSCLMVIDESSVLEAVNQRRGTTVLGTLNTAWSGGDLQNTSAGKDYRRHIPEGGYRLSGLVSAQPNATDALLGKNALNGTTQRFIFTKVSFAPGYEWPNPKPMLPAPLDLTGLPDNFWVDKYENTEEGKELDPFDIYEHGQAEPIDTIYAMQVPQSIIDEMDAAARDSKMDDTADATSGHLFYNRLKIAAALALLHGRKDVALEDWHRAKEVTDHSQDLRYFFEQAASMEREREAKAQGVMAVTVSEASEERILYRYAALLGRAVHNHGNNEKCKDGCQLRCMRDALKSSKGCPPTAAIEAAINRAKALDWLTESTKEDTVPGGKRHGARFHSGSKKPPARG